ncbi:MAG TPA: guanylate kinase [Dehalococcoidia bacterium]|nr:guanylate kinase [Dehalococcoidia bacterium]
MSLLLILSGPSGAGKDALLNRMKELGVPFHYVVTSTTRPPRTGEKDGVEYTFVSESGFQEMLQRGDLVESAKVYGYWYGVPKHEVKQALDEGKDVVLKIDVQGAATIRNLLPGAVLVFLTLPSLEEYERRLRQRKTESDTDLKVRLGKVTEELRSMLIFDYVVVNRQDELDGAVDQIKAIVAAEKCRVNPRVVQFK